MRMPSNIIGLDIGGANLKAALRCGEARSCLFELWKEPDNLGSALIGLLKGWDASHLALTMTGELCDCFQTKREGVERILAQVEGAFPESVIRVWSTGGAFVSADEGRKQHLNVSASNWHALTTLTSRSLLVTLKDKGSDDKTIASGIRSNTQSGLLIDVGSTTSDVIPYYRGKPIPAGFTDPARLKSRELVYIGVRRTPLCALLGPGTTNEFFATTHDAFLRLGLIAEDANDRHTADGRPATAIQAHARLARMLGGDQEITPKEDTRRLALLVYQKQRSLLVDAIRTVAARLPRRVEIVVLAGSGEFLARAAWNDYALLDESIRNESVEIISLSDLLGPVVSTAACAYATAVLAEESWHPLP